MSIQAIRARCGLAPCPLPLALLAFALLRGTRSSSGRLDYRTATAFSDTTEREEPTLGARIKSRIAPGLLAAGLGVAASLLVWSRHLRTLAAWRREVERLPIQPSRQPRAGDILLFHHAHGAGLVITGLTHSPF